MLSKIALALSFALTLSTMSIASTGFKKIPHGEEVYSWIQAARLEAIENEFEDTVSFSAETYLLSMGGGIQAGIENFLDHTCWGDCPSQEPALTIQPWGKDFTNTNFYQALDGLLAETGVENSNIIKGIDQIAKKLGKETLYAEYNFNDQMAYAEQGILVLDPRHGLLYRFYLIDSK